MKSIILKLVFLSIFFVISIFLEEKTPDWFGYERIFENGAWLADLGKDGGFLFVIKTFKIIFTNNYLLFRRVIDLMFLLVIGWLLSNKFLKNEDYSKKLIICSVCIIPLVLLRFTVQIREGLALVLILIALNIISRFGGINKNISFRNILLPLVLLFISASIHSGLSIFLIFFIYSILIGHIKANTKLDRIALVYINIVFFLIISIIIYKYLYSIKDIYYTGNGVNTSLNIAKIFYWFLWGCILYWCIKKMHDLLYIGNFDNLSIRFIKYTFCVLPIIFYAIGLIFLFTQNSNAIISGTSRIINILICISIFFISKLYDKNRKILFLISLFLIIDQIRVLLASMDSLLL